MEQDSRNKRANVKVAMFGAGMALTMLRLASRARADTVWPGKALQRFKDAHGWTDIGREHIRDPERYYSWWSYRAKNWRDGDRGRRLDHMWASPDLAQQAIGHSVFEDARDWEKPSDHIPLTTEFDL